jgi:hypothetical protein
MRAALLIVLLTTGACTLGCGGGGASSVLPPPPPPPSISVSVSPSSGTVILGSTASFTATVQNATDSAVTWSVGGVAGGNATLGTVTPAGVYTAPVDLPSPSAVQVTATSHQDPTKSASAAVTIASDIALSLTPNAAAVELGAAQAFQATVSSSGHPDSSVRWSVSGPACAAGCGTVDANGHFTAPQILPSPADATLTAQSVADPSKQASAAINITSSFTLQLSAPFSVAPGATAAIVATLTPVPGSNPSVLLSWSLNGSGCSGSACGTLTVTTTQSVGGNATANSATYTAPSAAPSPNTVTVTATPQADPTKKAQATIAVQAGVNVSLSPSTNTLAANHRITLTAHVNGTTNSALTWSVNGIPGGNSATGQICAVASNPCQPVASGGALQVDYLAPGAIPSPNPVNVQAVSAADTTKSASSQITILNHVVVSVFPGSVTLAPLAVQGFTASVLGTANQNVVWQIQGTGCANGLCGSIDANGAYTAPGAPPSPDSLQVVAVSSDDATQSGSANITISTGSNILALHPASVYAGAAQGFTLLVDGSGFVASSPGPGSVLLIGGTARTTTCGTATTCTTPVTAVDVATAGTVAIQMQNPGGTSSNVVSLVVAAPNTGNEVISLTSSAPAAAGEDIVVVDPTTAGVSVPGDDVDLNVGALGSFSTANNSCTLAGNPLQLQRPPSGTSTADICIFSESGLDISMTYTVSGTGDISVVAKQPAGLGIIHLTLQIPSTAAAGPRALFIQNTNLDEAAASGALEVN